MKLSILDILACPHCKSRLKCTSFSTEGKEVTEGILSCKCKRWYPIVASVPRMIPDDLRQHIFPRFGDFFPRNEKKIPKNQWSSKSTSFTKKQVDTIRGFGYEWTRFSKMHKEYESQFLNWVKPLQPSFFKGKLVLDAGCGTGRHTMISTKFGAEVVGLDLSESVEVAAKVNKGTKAHIVQGDIYNLPFRDGTFDFIYSIGVLHHLPEPERGFYSLVRVAKKKSIVYAWVYGREGNTLLKIMNPLRKHIISKLPLPIINFIAFFIMLFVYPVVKLVYAPLNSAQSTKGFAQRMLPQNAFFFYLSRFNFNINHSILFDQLVAPIANYYTKDEFAKWFENASLKEISLTWRNRNSWRGFGVK